MRTYPPVLTLLFSTLITSMALAQAQAQAQENHPSKPEAAAIAVGGGVFMLPGAAGNTGFSVGDDGTLLIDGQLAALAPDILQAIRAHGGDTPKLVLNTHFHSGSTGSNAEFGRWGTLLAQENVRLRLLEKNTAAAALPVVTFDDRLRLYFNNDEIDVIHLPGGHTDGDAIAWFKKANVVHLGDLFFNGMFPEIDLAAGGSIQGYIHNIETILNLIPADARIIPGHGKLKNIVELTEFLEMLKATRARVQNQMNSGKNSKTIVAEGLGPAWQTWATPSINAKRWIRTLQRSLSSGESAPARR